MKKITIIKTSVKVVMNYKISYIKLLANTEPFMGQSHSHLNFFYCNYYIKVIIF